MLSPIKMPFVSLLLAICLAGSAAANCPVGDLDGDCTVDWEDLKLFTQQWLNNPGDSANLNGTDGVDFTDFALLASNWQPKQPTVVLLNDSFEGAAWDANWSNDGWSPDSTQKYSGSYSAWAKDGNEGNFTCNDLNASDANAIYIDFWYRLTGDLEASDLILYYYNGSSYVEISQIGNGTEDTWLHYATTITDTQYFQSTFRIRFNAALDSGKNVWIDDVLIQKKLDSTENTLAISSTNGGSVTTPGEGQFSYNYDQIVPIAATADANYHFAGWLGDTSTIASPSSAGTTITMHGNRSIQASFERDPAAMIVINEIHYNPDVKVELVEFVELHNTGLNSVDLSGWYFSSGIDYTFPPGATIAPGGYVVVTEDPTPAYVDVNIAGKYGTNPSLIYGPFAGHLDNDGETIELRDGAGQIRPFTTPGLPNRPRLRSPSRISLPIRK